MTRNREGLETTRAAGEVEGKALDQRVYTSVWGAAGALRRTAEAVLAAESLSLQQYNILRILRGAGEALPTFEVAERMFDAAPAITRLLNRLVKRGLVRRRRTRTDRRKVLCGITEAGLEALRRLQPAIEEMDEAVMDRLSGREKRVLIRLLEKLVEGQG